MSIIHVPTINEIGESLSSLVGKTVEVNEAGAPNTFDDSVHTARYFTRDDQLAALIQVDLPLGASLGASLAMIPAAGAEEAAATGELNDNLQDAYSEVANIMAGMLCADGAPHVRWTELATTAAQLTEADKVILEKPCTRIDTQVEVADYGSGHLTIFTATLA